MQAFNIVDVTDIVRIEAGHYERFMPHGSIHDALSEAASRHAERIALTFITSADPDEAPQRWTYRQFIGEVNRTANLFASLAGEEEPRIAMLLPAIPAAYFTLWGGETAGVVCPINYLLGADHIAELIRASGANILVALGPARGARHLVARAPAARAMPRPATRPRRGRRSRAPRFRRRGGCHAGTMPCAFGMPHGTPPCRPLPYGRHHRRAEARPAHPWQPAARRLGRGAALRDGRARRDPQRLSAVPCGGRLRVRPLRAAVRRRGGIAHLARHAQHRVRQALLDASSIGMR